MNGSVVLTNLKIPFFTINNAEYITIKGIEMSGIRTSAIGIKNSSNICIELCVIANTVNKGIETSKISECRFISNHVYNTGDAGITVSGGDGINLTPGNNLAENNYVHDYGRVSRAYASAISLDGIGNAARNNKMSDSDQLAMRITGGEHLVENNEITNVLRTAADMGAIYMYREKQWRNTIFQNNWFHDIKAEGSTASHGIQGIYYDEMNDGAVVKNNFVINCGYDFKWCEIGDSYYAYLNAQNEITESKRVNDSIFVDASAGNFNIKEEYKDQFADGEAPNFKNMGMYTPWLARALRNETVSMAIGSPMTYKNFDMTYIDTENVNVVPFIANNKTYVPIRYIAEAFDGEVEYDDETHTVSVNISGNKISIDNKNNRLLLNGAEIEDAEPIVREERTYLPIRAVANTMNKTVTWYDKGVVIISENGEVIGQDEESLIEELYRRLV